MKLNHFHWVWLGGKGFAFNNIIYDGRRTVAALQKAPISFGDFYELDIKSSGDTAPALCVVLAIDCILAL